jgi:transcriptional regulator with XRE-family HTH domain
MAAQKKGKITQDAMSKMAGVSVRSLQKWEKEGIDITDEAAVRARAAQVDKRVADSEDMQGVKLRKLKAEADLKEHELQVERGLFVSKDEVVTEGVRMGVVIKGIFLKLSSDLTPILAGRPAAEIKKVLDKYAREKLTELSLYDSPIKVAAD